VYKDELFKGGEILGLVYLLCVLCAFFVSFAVMDFIQLLKSKIVDPCSIFLLISSFDIPPI
jgi:hypothetical protein